MEEKRNVCRILVRMTEEERPLGRTRRRWEDDKDGNKRRLMRSSCFLSVFVSP
jgi:hypothetical protein